jgi:hypothetical protein
MCFELGIPLTLYSTPCAVRYGGLSDKGVSTMKSGRSLTIVAVQVDFSAEPARKASGQKLESLPLVEKKNLSAVAR